MRKILVFLFIIISVNAQSFSSGQVYLEVTNAGSTLFGSPDSQNLQVTRISLLVSGNENQVFDYLNDADAADTTAITVDTADFGDYQVRTIFDNSFSFAPPAYKVVLNTYGWSNAAYTVSHYHITNIDSNVYDAKVGFEVLPFIDNTFGNEFVEYYDEGGYIRMNKDTASTFVGIKILSSPINSLYVEDWVSGYNKSDTSLYQNIFYGSIIDTFNAADSGSVLFPSIQQQTIVPGEATDVYIALATGLTQSQLDSNINAATNKYNNIITTGIEDSELPLQFSLEQNYPNPFNPTTNIRFAVPQREYVELNVYNILGQLVEKIIDKQLNAGSHEVVFNAKNIASGVYFYTLNVGEFVATKKMMILK